MGNIGLEDASNWKPCLKQWKIKLNQQVKQSTEQKRGRI